MSKSNRISIPPPKERNPLCLNGGRGTGRQVFRDKRSRRGKDARKSWQRDQSDDL